MPIFLLLLGILGPPGHAQYSGYNAAGKNPGWRSGSERSPLNVPYTYHSPNQYENQPYSYWYENMPFHHAHPSYPETYSGKLHRHQIEDDPPHIQNFITDPPGVGLNTPAGGDSSPKATAGTACDSSNPYDSPDCNPSPTQVYPTTRAVSAHATEELLDIDTENTTESIHNTETKIISVHEAETIVEDTKKPCCPCCKDESSTTVKPALITPKPVFLTLKPPLITQTQRLTDYVSYVNPPSIGDGSYPIAPSYYPTSQSYSSSYGCGGGGFYQQNSAAAGCCGDRLPSCCLPQIPCCPRIEFPCCPQQPICCQPFQGCGVCRSRVLRQRRTKRFGCIPCAGRKKRQVLDEIHVRRKRLGCVPCLRRRKREQPKCTKCSSFTTRMVQRIRRSTSERCLEPSSNTMSSNRLSWDQVFERDRSKRSTVDPTYDSVFECDQSCCDYSACIRSKPLNV